MKLPRWILPAVMASCVIPAPAQTDEAKGKQLIDQTLAALGGEKFLAMKDRVEEGRAYSFYRERLSGLSRAKIYTRYLTRPEPPVAGFFGVRERQAFGKKEESAFLFTEEEAYEVTFRGARPVPAATRQRYRETTLNNIFYILRQRLGEPGLTILSKGGDVFENVPVNVVEISDGENRSVTVFLHHSTNLPVRQVFFRRDPDTKDRIEEVSRFSKYRDVGDGVQWPFAIERERNGEKIYEIFSESVTINQDLKDDLFTLPANMKILKLAR